MVSFIVEKSPTLRGLKAINIWEHTEVDAAPEEVQEVVELFQNAESMKEQRDKLLSIGDELLSWEQHMGGFESPVWGKLRKVLAEATGATVVPEDDDDGDDPHITICECGRPVNECAIKDGGDQHRNRG